MTARANLHPLTLTSIATVTNGHGNIGCGCAVGMRREWYLCDYHRGYEDGIEAQQEQHPVYRSAADAAALLAKLADTTDPATHRLLVSQAVIIPSLSKPNPARPQGSDGAL